MPCTVLCQEVQEDAAAGMGTVHMVCLVFVSMLLGAGICKMLMVHSTASDDVYGSGDQASDVWAAQFNTLAGLAIINPPVCMLTTSCVITAAKLLVECLYACKLCVLGCTL